MGPAKPASMQERYASPADWDAQRETITELYLHQRRSLLEVMEVMAVEHNFLATIKMYRSRLKRWGLGKNNKAAEVAYMLKLKKQREVQGKKSLFLVRNRPVDWDDIERYLARTPDFWAKHTGDCHDSTSTSQEIICRTPPPDSPRSTPESIPQMLDAAQELHIHEEILRFFRDYTEGSFEQNLWSLSPIHGRYFGRGGPDGSARLNAWYDKMRNVSDWPGRDADVVRLVNYLLDDLPQFVRDQDFTVFPVLMRCCFNLSARRPELGRAVVHFVARLCAVILGEKHPMSLAWARIQSLPKPEYMLVLQGMAKIRLDNLASRQGNGIQDENIVNALREYLLVLRLRGSAAADELTRVTSWAREQLSQTASEGLSPSHCRLLLGTASSYMACGRFDEAEAALDRVGASLPATSMSPQTNPNSLRVLPTYLFLMGFLRYATRRMDEAVNYFLQTYAALEKARGPNSSAVADILLALIDFPGLLQNPDDIKHWTQKFTEVQADILARAQRGVKQTPADLSEVFDGPLDTDVNTGKW